MEKVVDFIIDSINASRDRLKMSIVTFYLSLLALYHWRVFAILFFGGMSMEKKIEKIDIFYIDWTWCDYIFNPILILLISILSALLFPIIMWGIEFVLLTPTEGRKKIKNEGLEIDRLEDRKIEEHKYELLQISSGHKNTEQFVNEIKHLKDENERLTEDYEVSIKNERNKSDLAIENLTNGFRQVEDNYKKQISELNRQLEMFNNSIVEDSLYLVSSLPREVDGSYFVLKDINAVYKSLSYEEKRLANKIRNVDKMDEYNLINLEDVSSSFIDFLNKLKDFGVIDWIKRGSSVDIRILEKMKKYWINYKRHE
ncbi:hypothetical protein [Myroides odoratimimus]|uniref:hypothetical protein n=1 Tax=Myroides odoratimimus TaxID=76832 RepID=UPI000468D350|nr:hypothetical protein [Myroides odoratimimus]